MKEFQYVIKDNIGIHARPAGLLVKKAAEFTSKVTIKKGDKTADASRLFSVMGLSVKYCDTVTVEVEGDDEQAAVDALKAFFEVNL